MEIWCNESQERYVSFSLSHRSLHVPEYRRLDMFSPFPPPPPTSLSRSHSASPFGIVGTATAEQELVVTDRLLGKDIIRLGMGVLFGGKPPRMHRVDEKVQHKRIKFDGTFYILHRARSFTTSYLLWHRAYVLF